MRSSIGKSSVPGPDRETETTPHDVTLDLMTGKPTDRTCKIWSGLGCRSRSGKFSSLSLNIKPGMGEAGKGKWLLKQAGRAICCRPNLPSSIVLCVFQANHC